MITTWLRFVGFIISLVLLLTLGDLILDYLLRSCQNKQDSKRKQQVWASRILKRK